MTSLLLENIVWSVELWLLCYDSTGEAHLKMKQFEQAVIISEWNELVILIQLRKWLERVPKSVVQVTLLTLRRSVWNTASRGENMYTSLLFQGKLPMVWHCHYRVSWDFMLCYGLNMPSIGNIFKDIYTIRSSWRCLVTPQQQSTTVWTSVVPSCSHRSYCCCWVVLSHVSRQQI